MVEDLFTLPSARRRGVITGVIATFVDRLRASGCRPIVIVALANERPKHLYARLGFRPVTLARTWTRKLPDWARREIRLDREGEHGSVEAEGPQRFREEHKWRDMKWLRRAQQACSARLWPLSCSH